jgi:hypothetical protein
MPSEHTRLTSCVLNKYIDFSRSGRTLCLLRYIKKPLGGLKNFYGSADFETNYLHFKCFKT